MQGANGTTGSYLCAVPAHGRPSIVPLVDLGPPPDLRASRQVDWEKIPESRREPLDIEKLHGILCTIKVWIESSIALFSPSEFFGSFCRESSCIVC